MLAVHRIFQMIFGIIVSAAILYFLITYSVNYQDTQRTLQRSQILEAFADEARAVWLTGLSTNFTHFSRYDFSSCMIEADGRNVPEIKCSGSGFSDVPIETPVLLLPGEKESVFVGRDGLDYGWWVMNFAEVMPSLTFVFNPIEGTDGNWEVMRTIVEHLPDTSDDWSVVKVNFAFCDGPDLLYVCGGGKPCGKTDFLSILGLGHDSGFSRCTAGLKGDMRIVTISGSCSSSFPESGVCIAPPNDLGVGNAFLEGSAKAYVWKDPLDLVALSVGGSEKDDFGKALGERIYAYKNSAHMARMSLAAQVASKRAILIAGKVAEETGCGPVYIELSQALDGIEGKDYMSAQDMEGLNERLGRAEGLYRSLQDKGCERLEYGL